MTVLLHEKLPELEISGQHLSRNFLSCMDFFLLINFHDSPNFLVNLIIFLSQICISSWSFKILSLLFGSIN